MSFDQQVSAEQRPFRIEAMALVSDVNAPLPCIVLDVFKYGARLEEGADTSLPDRFDLVFPIANDIVFQRSVVVQWRRGNVVGVCFRPN